MQKKLLSSTLVYSVLMFLPPLIGFIMQPYYIEVANFSDAEYGILGFMTTYANWVQIVSALCIGNSVFTFYYTFNTTEHDIRTFIGQVLSFSVYSGLLFLCLMLVAGSTLFKLVFNSDQITFYPYGLLATFSGIAYNIWIPFIWFLRNSKKLRLYIILVVSSSILSVLAQVCLISGLGWGISGALGGKALGIVVMATTILVLNYKYLSFRLQPKFLREPLKFVRYLVPNMLLGWSFTFVDRWMVERFLSIAILGIYTWLNIMASMVGMAYEAFKSAIIPFLYEAFALAPNEQAREVRQLYKFYIGLTVMAVSGIVLIVCHIHYLVSKPNFIGIQQYIFVYALSYLFSGLNVLGYLDFYYVKNSRKIMQYNVAGIISIFGCTLIGIYYLELWGVVIGLLMARIINFLLLYGTYSKFRKRINNYNILLLLSLAISLIVGSGYIANSHLLSYPLVGWLQFTLISLIMVYTNKQMFRQVLLPKIQTLWPTKPT